MNRNRTVFPLLLLLCMCATGQGQQRLEVGVSINDKELSMPWNGGFNAPQFANIDLNRDGIKDMISFDRQGDMLRTYLRMPASGRWVLDWEYRSIFPPVVDWIQIADYDKDGVEDLFTSSSATGIPGVTVYKGAFQNEQWSFVKHIDREREYLQIAVGPELANLYVSWDDIPAIQDVDGDSDLDIIAFEPGSGSYITYFSNQSIENGWGTDSLRFEIEDLCWGKILENDLSEEVYLSDDPDICSDGNFTGGDIITPRHAGSTIMLMDPDFDGDHDAWIGDITSRRLVFLRNGLNSEQAWITEQDSHWPSGDTSVALPFFIGAYAVELDDDPEPEILGAVNSRSLAEDRQSVWRYDDDPFTDGPLDFHLTEKGAFQNEMIDVGSYARPAIADVDGDGLPDLVTGGYHYEEGSLTRSPSLWWFRNDGSSTHPYFTLAATDYLSMSEFSALNSFDFAPAFGDIDGNGSIDLLVGEQNGKLFFFKNNAAKDEPFNFSAALYPYMNINVGVSSAPQIADINGDGMGDLVIGERTGNTDNTGRCSNLNYFENAGIAGNAVFNPDVMLAPNTQCFGRVLFDTPIGLPQYSTPFIMRTQDDWLLMTGTDRGHLEVYRDLNNGKTGEITLVDERYGDLDFGNRSSPAAADLDSDGFYELVVGNQRGGLEMFDTDIEVGTVSVVMPGKESDRPYSISTLSYDGIFYINWEDGKNGVDEVIDVWGRVLEREHDSHSFQGQIDLSSQCPGIYYIKLRLEDKYWMEKVVYLKP